MNPLDLSGPQFLIFYFVLILISVAIVYLLWYSLGRSGNFRRPMTDPYQIAYLRGGPKETVKIVVASLTHREYMKVSGSTITTVGEQAQVATNQLEKTVLEDCLLGKTFEQLADGKACEVAKKLFHQRLVSEHLILSDSERQMVLFTKTIMIASLIVVAVAKIFIAFQRGRYNVTFLIILAMIGVVIHVILNFWCTPNGITALKDLKTLFGRLRGQANQLTNTSQNHNFSLLLAVFGVSVISSREYAFLSAFKPIQSRGSSSSASSTSSCGSSSSCGGGGGGCGGCGS